MKRFKISLCFALIAVILCTSSFSFIYKPQCRKADDVYPVLDSDKTSGLPDNFRKDTALNISGSAQFTPPQLGNIINEINQKDITIVDLRQETHGFINDYAVRLFSPSEVVNRDCSSKQVLQAENQYFSSIKPGDSVNIYTRRKALKETLTVARAETEEQLVKESNTAYVLFAVQDGSIPSPQVVDDFVEFVKNKRPETHIHFHCRAGEGRTTTFMVMYQIMADEENMSLEEIFEYQQALGGIDLSKRPSRAEFLEEFYSYVRENKAQGYIIKYSNWIQKNS